MTKIYNICETFVGCGGCHFGFKKLNFKTIFVNDIWSDAITTLRNNDTDLNENQIILDDIQNINLKKLNDLNLNIDNVDVFVGGVVCKGFSMAGIRNPFDERNYLYKQQLRLVKILKPKISIIENVPGMISMKILKKNVSIESICKKLNEYYTTLKKMRGVLINMKKQEKSKKEVDEYRKKTKKVDNKKKELEESLNKYKYNVVEDIENEYIKLGYKVYKKVLKCSEYGCSTNRKRLFIVAIRNDINIEWEYPEPTTKDRLPTVKDALDKLDMININKLENDHDNIPMNHRKKTVEKFKKIIAGVKAGEGYFSRGSSSRLFIDRPAPTLVPGHSSFQIHPTEHRSITVREAALITGFDNDFKFNGSHSSRCMQIGNAIPVNMAYNLAKQCKKFLDTYYNSL